MKKRFTYEYDDTMEMIIKSLINKSYVTSRDYQILMDNLIRNAYGLHKKRFQ